MEKNKELIFPRELVKNRKEKKERQSKTKIYYIFLPTLSSRKVVDLEF